MICVLGLLWSAACSRASRTSATLGSEARGAPDKVVVLTFDDAVKSHYATVAPMLKRYGFGATFFVTEFQAPPFSDTTLYMTWPQIAELSRMGFEIGNHTWKHTHVDKMDGAQFAAELRYVEDTLRALGVARPTSFAYPAYVTSPAALVTLREHAYRLARVGDSRAWEPAHDNPLLIPSYTTGADNRAEILRAFGEARDGKIVVLTIHGVPDTAHPWVTTPVALLEEYLTWLHDNHYRVISLRDAARYAR